MANVFDVAKYILTEIGEVSTMKLQKLCYYSFIDRMATSGEKLFDEGFEAWANGPVCRALFNVHKGKFTCTAAMIPNNLLLNDLTQEELNSINRTLEKYGSMTGAELSEQTHKEKPWLDARKGLPLSARCTKRITLNSIREYYGKV